MKEFYARNSRWTEGLISAAKAVGWGATQMVYVSATTVRKYIFSVCVYVVESIFYISVS